MCDSAGYILIDDNNSSYFLMEMGNVKLLGNDTFEFLETQVLSEHWI